MESIGIDLPERESQPCPTLFRRQVFSIQSLPWDHLIISNTVSLNGAFEAPSPPPDGWLVLDPGRLASALEMQQAADAIVLGRKTYEGLAAVWPQLDNVPGYEAFAQRMNGMSKYVASRTLRAPLTWNAALLERGRSTSSDSP